MRLRLVVKRIFDLICSFVGLICLLPVFIVVAIAIKLDSPGPIFFRQTRGGKDGQHFQIFKFRTMCDHAVKKGLGYKTAENDPRITRIGHFLRKTSIDELPQLINVLQGEMSLVGPRPTLTVQTDQYNNYQKQRLQMKPGITGYAQINGRNNLNWDEKIELDIYYIKNFSLWLDCKILIKTVAVIFNVGQIYNQNNSKSMKS